jgi:hypothetical protein
MAAPIELNFEQTITIAKDASLSGAIDLKGATCLGFICPAAIEATTVQLGFFASDSLTGTYNAVKRSGTALKLTFAVDDYALMPNPEDLVGVRFLKIEAQTAVPAAVVQATAARVFKVIKKVGL